MPDQINKRFTEEQYERFKMPWKNTAFVSYFIWIVFLFGGLGIISTLISELSSNDPHSYIIAQSIATTSVALTAASLIELNLSFNIRNIPSLIINTVACFGLTILLLFFTFKLKSCLSFIPAILCYLISILIWILANADNQKLSDETYYKIMYQGANELSKDWGK